MKSLKTNKARNWFQLNAMMENLLPVKEIDIGMGTPLALSKMKRDNLRNELLNSKSSVPAVEEDHKNEHV